MVTKKIPKGWENLIGKDLPKIKLTSHNIDWVFELLGWRKNARRTN